MCGAKECQLPARAVQKCQSRTAALHPSQSLLAMHSSDPRPNSTAKLFSHRRITLHAKSIAAQELNFDIQFSLAEQKREGKSETV